MPAPSGAIFIFFFFCMVEDLVEKPNQRWDEGDRWFFFILIFGLHDDTFLFHLLMPQTRRPSTCSISFSPRRFILFLGLRSAWQLGRGLVDYKRDCFFSLQSVDLLCSLYSETCIRCF